MIQPERIQPLNDKPLRSGRFVLYWMQQAQRAEWNHALEYAVREGNRLEQPVVVVFGITDSFPEANLRHYRFMLEGLKETSQRLRDRGIRLIALHRAPDDAALALAGDASLLVADRGYLRVQKGWRNRVAEEADCAVAQIESDVVVAIEAASQKEEYSAATLRRKLHKCLDDFMVPLETGEIKKDSLGMKFDGLNLDDPDGVLSKLSIDRSVEPVAAFRGGASEANRLLDTFIADKLKDYDERRNEPVADCVSHMSPYLHFGQISPLQIALAVDKARGKPRKAKDAYLEELIVRRELSMNFVAFNAHYDSYSSLPDWARATLKSHEKDKREYVYSGREFEKAETHDPYWNAAQREMVKTGKMHNYMRMYWGKKILEWSESPEKAFRTAIALNNKYELDGRDPNSFAGVAWCFGKHDRPWQERRVFGTVRFMSAGGLERKFDIDAYVEKVETL